MTRDVILPVATAHVPRATARSKHYSCIGNRDSIARRLSLIPIRTRLSCQLPISISTSIPVCGQRSACAFAEGERWNSRISVSAEGNAEAVAASSDPAAFLIFPDNLFGNVFVDPDVVDLRYSSSLNSLELNLPCCCGCCDKCGDECGCGEVRCRSSEWFAGFRYINLSEELNISAQRIVAGGLEEGSYDIRTTNHLYGVQLGMRERRTRGSIRLGSHWKSRHLRQRCPPGANGNGLSQFPNTADRVESRRPGCIYRRHQSFRPLSLDGCLEPKGRLQPHLDRGAGSRPGSARFRLRVGDRRQSIAQRRRHVSSWCERRCRSTVVRPRMVFLYLLKCACCQQIRRLIA